MRIVYAIFLFVLCTSVAAQDVAPVTAPENLLASHAKGLHPAPLTSRVWSTEELLHLANTLPSTQADALRRLINGAEAPPVHTTTGFIFATGEDKLRLAGRVGGIISLSAHTDFVFSVDTARSLYEQRPILPWAQTAQLRFYTPLGEWRIGQAPIRWGGGYSGALLLSDNAPPLLHVDYRKQWYLGKRLGTWHFEQMAAIFEEGGSRRYVMARRLGREISPRWQISFAEAFKANKLPDGLIAVVVPFYPYQLAYTWWRYDNNDNWFNYLASIQACYRLRNQRLYLELLLDDLQAPRWLTRFRYKTPRKAGVLVGYHLSLPRSANLTVEVAHTDGNPGGGVYNFKHPDNRWVYRDAVLGHPVGTNRDMLWLRLDAPLGRQSYLAIEHVNTRMANASPDVPVSKEWTVHLYWVYAERYVAGIRWQNSRIRDDQQTRWLLQAGWLF